MLALRSGFFTLLLLLTACTAYGPARYAYGTGGQFGYGAGYYTSYAPAVRVMPPVIEPYPVRFWGSGRYEHDEHREERRDYHEPGRYGGGRGHDSGHRHGG